MKTRHSAEQIVANLRQANVELGKGLKVPEVRRQLGVSEQMYYRWRTKYGGMDTLVAKQMKELERENARLKKLESVQELAIPMLNRVTDLFLDETIRKGCG